MSQRDGCAREHRPEHVAQRLLDERPYVLPRPALPSLFNPRAESRRDTRPNSSEIVCAFRLKGSLRRLAELVGFLQHAGVQPDFFLLVVPASGNDALALGHNGLKPVATD